MQLIGWPWAPSFVSVWPTSQGCSEDMKWGKVTYAAVSSLEERWDENETHWMTKKNMVCIICAIALCIIWGAEFGAILWPHTMHVYFNVCTGLKCEIYLSTLGVDKLLSWTGIAVARQAQMPTWKACNKMHLQTYLKGVDGEGPTHPRPINFQLGWRM